MRVCLFLFLNYPSLSRKAQVCAFIQKEICLEQIENTCVLIRDRYICRVPESQKKERDDFWHAWQTSLERERVGNDEPSVGREVQLRCFSTGPGFSPQTSRRERTPLGLPREDWIHMHTWIHFAVPPINLSVLALPAAELLSNGLLPLWAGIF